MCPLFLRQVFGMVVDTPVAYNDRGHGPDWFLDQVQLLGKVVDTLCVKVVDTPVVYNDRGHGPEFGPCAVTRQGR